MCIKIHEGKKTETKCFIVLLESMTDPELHYVYAIFKSHESVMGTPHIYYFDILFCHFLLLHPL